MNNKKIKLRIDEGSVVDAQAPMIISASRATDIPVFYSRWFINRLSKGYVRWRNPYNGKVSYVSFANTKFIIFWSKNPAPLLPFLPILKQKGIGCYIQYTLNDYESEGLEPNVPPIIERIETFKRLVDGLGPGSVVWRFDPLILTDDISADKLLHKICKIANHLHGYTEKLVFSFADISTYRKVGRNLTDAGVNYQEWTEEAMMDFARSLSSLNLGIELTTCAEKVDLSQFGTGHNRCIDPELIFRIKPELKSAFSNLKNDKGQRALCGCITAKDIGAYNTCPHGCVYCYANASPYSVRQNFIRHKQAPDNDSII